MSRLTTRRAGLPPMSEETRGHAIQSRRLALGVKSIREFSDATGIDREALSKAERGKGSAQTYDRVEAWLDRLEEETGQNDPSPEPLRFTFHDIYGIGEFIAEGPGDRPDELIEAVARMLKEIRER